jgi:nucleotide-binding universal stress UspA family protein
MKPLMKILVAYDGSVHADNALGEAIDLAQKFKGSITVLYVAWEKSDEDSHVLLLNAEERLKKAGVKHTLRVERSNYTPRIIVRTAMDDAFDLITIGSRGMGEGKGWLLGSVSSRVIEEAPCPVLVVK